MATPHEKMVSVCENLQVEENDYVEDYEEIGTCLSLHNLQHLHVAAASRDCALDGFQMIMAVAHIDI